ncbi:MAG TPA: apolipoprotein N-acyltransferase [Thermoanaerobaculia bacterium]|nr:apolipoprotein N-acyltransferase [Thermoanaerobaculia bacterium]
MRDLVARSRALRIGLAVISGVLFGLSFPTYSLGWLMFVALLPLVFAAAWAGGWEAVLLGWLSNSVAWLMMAPWVIRVMSHYGGLPYAVGVLIYIAMAIYLGIFGGLFAFFVHRLRLGDGLGRWLLLPLAWAAVEYARTYLLTGFPWNLIATAIVDYTPLIQIDRVAGPYATGALILVPGVTLGWLITARAPVTHRLFAVAGIVILGVVWPMTGLVAAKLIARPTGEPAVTAALLQPNISQEMRWDEANIAAIFDKMQSMTGEAVAHGAQIIIWPESTVPLAYSSTGFYRSYIESVSREHGVDIILGSIADDPTRPSKLWNSAFLVSGGKTIGHYDKIHLVPFGEYVPLKKALFFAEKLTHDVGDFEFGTNDTPLRGRMAYGPAICYEIVYPQIARTQVIHGAEVLVTITNDAWYDGTSAPEQHLAQARLRAIEDDRYLLRAATTGISAFVDPSGRLIQSLPMPSQGIIYAEFHPRHSTTPYVRFGDWFAFASIAIVLGVVVAGWRRGAKVGP